MASAEVHLAKAKRADLVFQAAWHAPAQGVLAEAQLCNAPVVVGGDALPFAEGRVAQPVVAAAPVLTVCVVEGNQRFPVRLGGAGGRNRPPSQPPDSCGVFGPVFSGSIVPLALVADPVPLRVRHHLRLTTLSFSIPSLLNFIPAIVSASRWEISITPQETC